MPILVPHRLLIAPSGFKESLDSTQVAQAMACGARRALTGVHLDIVPMVDGGEGTASALAAATGGRLVPVTAIGPVDEPVETAFALLGGSQSGTAVVEMAAVAGLRLVPADRRDPTRTTSRGVGELIRAAADAGARRIVIGCGDSGTSDGGAGLVQALGGRILDADGCEIGSGGAELARAVRLDLTDLDPRLARIEMVAACNVHNLLTGPSGVARVFGPQKGATSAQVETLSAALENWARLLTETCGDRLAGFNVATGAGSGASGGLGAALRAVCGARLANRFDVLLDPALTGFDLDAAIATADLVLTAEGALDGQTPRGKVPAEVAARAKNAGKPVIALAGTLGVGVRAVHDVGIDATMTIVSGPMDLGTAVDGAFGLLADATERTLRLVTLGCAVAAAGSPATRLEAGGYARPL